MRDTTLNSRIHIFEIARTESTKLLFRFAKPSRMKVSEIPDKGACYGGRPTIDKPPKGLLEVWKLASVAGPFKPKGR
jgi:hypothetical protein